MKQSTPISTETNPWLHLVRDKIAGIRFGVVQILVHEGKVTQIECTEKLRIDERPALSPIGR